MRGDEFRIPHPKAARPEVHEPHEGALVAGDVLGEGHGSVVGQGRSSAVRSSRTVFLPRLEADLPPPTVAALGDTGRRLLEVGHAFHDDESGHQLSQAGDRRMAWATSLQGWPAIWVSRIAAGRRRRPVPVGGRSCGPRTDGRAADRSPRRPATGRGPAPPRDRTSRDLGGARRAAAGPRRGQLSCRCWRRPPQERLLQLAGQAGQVGEVVCAACRRASRWRCRMTGMTIDSNRSASRSAKWRYMVRWRGSIP